MACPNCKKEETKVYQESTIRTEIVEMMKNYNKTYKARATAIRLTAKDADRLFALSASDIGAELAARFRTIGKEALKKEGKYYLLGMEVVDFNADVTCVTREVDRDAKESG